MEDTIDTMTALAAQFAEASKEHTDEGKRLERIRDRLRQFMDLEGVEELIDGETGRGVRFDKKGAATTTWDTSHLTDEQVLHLRDSLMLDVRTKLFDEARKAGGDIMLDDINRSYRITGERARALRVVEE